MAEVTQNLDSVKTSSRDLAVIHKNLSAWLEKTLGPGSEPKLSELRNPGTGGMSSETLLFDLTWKDNGVEKIGSFVGRLPPPSDAFPIFPKYDFDLQVGVMRLVGERSNVKVPKVLWRESSSEPLGMPFFIMARSEGEPAPDLPPYLFDGWLLEADPADQMKLQNSAVACLAGIHSIKTTPAEVEFLKPKQPGATDLRRQFADIKAYYEWAGEGLHVPLIEELRSWLEANWPKEEGESTICWGDARPGNILWKNFEAQAVLDWEMATFSSRETDVAWLIFFHKYFQAIAAKLGFPTVPMPEFLRRDDVVAEYERLTGYKIKNINWYLGFSLLRMSQFDIRVAKRAIKFGEREPESDPNNYLFAGELIRKLLRGEEIWA